MLRTHVVHFMDLAGVEPASENPSDKTSSITVIYLHSLTQPPNDRLMHSVASLVLLPPQSFGGEVPYLFDAVSPSSRLPEGDMQLLGCVC